MKILLLFLLLSVINQYVFEFIFTDILICLLTAYLFVNFIRTLSVQINILDIVGFIASLVYLLLPLVVYNVYNEHNALARYWETYMTIEKNTYYSLALPGTLLFIIGLNTSRNKQKISDFQLLRRCKIYLSDKKHLGIILIVIGAIFSFTIVLIPEPFNIIGYYFSQLTFLGFLYLLHSRVGLKTLLIILALVILVAQSVMTGMYGELVYWSVLGGVILIVGKREFGVAKRIVWLLFGIFTVLLIQSIKHEYRERTWEGRSERGNLSLFYTLVKERLGHPENVVNPLRIYGVIIRGNQGRLVGRAMEYVPRYEEFAKGETIITMVAASIIPRFLWSDKPRVGGVENTCRFLGDCSKRKYSYNIGQLGESYVNFGIIGGAIFMFFYGYFMRFSYNTITNIAISHPTLILWIPLFFFMAISLETDFLTFLNSFLKAVIFAFIFYTGFKLIFKIRI